MASPPRPTVIRSAPIVVSLAFVLAAGFVSMAGCPGGNGNGGPVEINSDAGNGGGDAGDQTCPSGTTQCGSSCVDLNDNDRHCGSCGNACEQQGATGTCRQGSCTAWTCKEGWLNTDGDVTNGCERQCSGRQLTSSGVLDVDLEDVEVTGSLSLTGSVPDDLSRWSGQLVFQHLGTGSSATVGLSEDASTATTDFRVRLFPGSYRIEFRTSDGCDAGGRGAACGAQTLRESLTIESDGNLDLEADYRAEPIDVSGAVTVDGSTVEAESGETVGRLQFSSDTGYTEQTDVDIRDGRATYEAELVAGTYDIRILPPRNCDEESNPLPCQDAKTIVTDRQLGTSGQLDLDVSVVEVTGSVTLDGSPPADAPDGQERAVIAFGSGGDSSVTDGLGAEGAADYSVRLYAGEYDVSLQPASRDRCQSDPLEHPFPCADRIVRRGISLTSSGNLDIDASTVDVSGELTVDGESVGGGRDDVWGTVTFTGPRGTGTALLGPNADGRYEIRLYAGTYDVRLGNPLRCTGGDDSPLPCQTHTYREEFGIETSGTLDIDVSVVDVAGEVTTGGESVSGSPGTRRGSLLFVPAGEFTPGAGDSDGEEESDPGGVVASLGDEGAAEYETSVYAGTYDVVYQRQQCGGDLALPCQTDLRRQGLGLTSSGNLDVDLSVVSVEGEVTVDGQTMPASVSGDSRGTVGFQRVDGAGTGPSEAVGDDGPANYSVDVIAGTYRVGFQGRDCPADATTTGAVPCMSRLVAGCQ